MAQKTKPGVWKKSKLMTENRPQWECSIIELLQSNLWSISAARQRNARPFNAFLLRALFKVSSLQQALARLPGFRLLSLSAWLLAAEDNSPLVGSQYSLLIFKIYEDYRSGWKPVENWESKALVARLQNRVFTKSLPRSQFTRWWAEFMNRVNE